MTTVIEKIENVYALIKEIADEDPAVGNLLLEGFGVAVNTIKTVAENGERKEVDLNAQVAMVTKALGYNLEDLVMHVIQEMGSGQQPGIESEILNAKAPDAETLEFITSTENLDDYEKFLAKAKAADSLDFLKKEL